MNWNWIVIFEWPPIIYPTLIQIYAPRVLIQDMNGEKKYVDIGICETFGVQAPSIHEQLILAVKRSDYEITSFFQDNQFTLFSASQPLCKTHNYIHNIW